MIFHQFNADARILAMKFRKDIWKQAGSAPESDAKPQTSAFLVLDILEFFFIFLLISSSVLQTHNIVLPYKSILMEMSCG